MAIGENAQYESMVHEGVVVTATQRPEEVLLLQDLIQREQPAVIVELGTGAGGLTLALHEAAPETPLYTFDRSLAAGGEYVTTEVWRCHQYRRDWYGPAVVFCPADLLGAEVPPRLREALGLRGRKLLLCDNGDKAVEVRRYSPLLGAGDILGVHDWDYEVTAEKIEDALQVFQPLRWEECEASSLSWRFWVRDG